MKTFGLVAVVILILSCSGKPKQKRYTARQLDTIRKASFVRLGENDAYDFINNYYVPRLDTLGTKRKIWINPLKTKDLLKSYLTSINEKPPREIILDQPFLGPDCAYQWNPAKLKNVWVVSGKDTANLSKYRSKTGSDIHYDTTYIKKWHQKFGRGYVYVSYPMYNPYTHLLFISEWLENESFCGMGRDAKFWYKKVDGKWVAY